MRDHPLLNRYTAAYAIAVLLHLLFLALLGPADQLLGSRMPEPLPRAEPLAFEFVESAADPESTPPAERRFMSDRNARSRDRSAPDLSRSAVPYNAGLAESRDAFETRAGERRDTQTAAGERAEAGERGEPVYRPDDLAGMDAARTTLTQSQREEAVYGHPAVSATSVALDQSATRALDEGGLQLSTYNWEFAPYLKYLKRHIESHIFPPAAFSKLGIIEGKNTVRFRIYPDGHMEAMEVLAAEGSDLLVTTSTRAVEQAAPYRPLPEGFPDPYLEITGLFGYIIYRGPSR